MWIVIALASSAQAGQSAGLPQMDSSTYVSQLFWLAVVFGVMYWMMAAVFLPRLGGIIEERRNRIADDYDQAAELKCQAEKAEKAYKDALGEARVRAAVIAAETRLQLDEEIGQMQTQTDATLARQVEIAEASIADMRQEARTKVNEAAVETTKAIVVALMNETPSEDVIKQAVCRIDGQG